MKLAIAEMYVKGVSTRKVVTITEQLCGTEISSSPVSRLSRDGYREVLGVSARISEAEAHGRHFLESLSARGLRGIELITSDDHSGLRAARRAVFPIEAYRKAAPRFVEWLEENVEESFTVYRFPRAHQRRIRIVRIHAYCHVVP